MISYFYKRHLIFLNSSLYIYVPDAQQNLQYFKHCPL